MIDTEAEEVKEAIPGCYLTTEAGRLLFDYPFPADRAPGTDWLLTCTVRNELAEIGWEIIHPRVLNGHLFGELRRMRR